jgi:uncharacterized protein YbcI
LTANDFLTGDELLGALTDAMVGLHERQHGRKPASAKSLMMGDDVLACILVGVYTEVEKTMIELGRQAAVRENRNARQKALRKRFISEVQRLSGRQVLAFFPNHDVDPDLEILLYVLRPLPSAPDAECRSGHAARAQLAAR